MIKVKSKGDYNKAGIYLKKLKKNIAVADLAKYGEMGVEALRAATPVRTGKTAASWEYKIVRNGKRVEITWYNTNTNDGANIALLIQSGHGTRMGTYVQGIDYINPAMSQVFDQIGELVWKEVTDC